MSEFLSMGGYAPYVWSSYGVTLVVLVYNAWAAYRQHANSLARLRHSGTEHDTGSEPTVRQIK